MSEVASIISLAVFLAFATTGLQKLIFNTLASQTAERLGFTKAWFQRLGVLEMLGAIAVLVGLAGKHGTWQYWSNLVGVAGLTLMMVGATILHLRRGDGWRGALVALGFGAACVVVLVLRLV